MKKEELLAAGVPEESIRAVQRLNGLDIEREKKKLHVERERADQASSTRSAIVKISYLLPLNDLQALLVFANELYAKNLTKKEEA